jgi:hypothetical protein
LQWASQSGELRWHSNLLGDFNQNTVVEMSDLSPFAASIHSEATEDPDLQKWAIDRYRNGVIEVGDLIIWQKFLGTAITGYAIFGTTDSAIAGGDPHAQEQLEPLGVVEGVFADFAGGSIGHRGYLHWTPTFDPTGWYFWVRPVIPNQQIGLYPYHYGTRSGLIQVK